jgi:hypothetical protein
MADALTRDLLYRRWTALDTEFSSWRPVYKELSDFILPFSGRFTETDRNKGQKRYTGIIDSTATRSLDVLAAGLMSGMTSPARPWFRLQTADPDLNNFHTVKLWLNDVTRIMLDMFQRTNTYGALHSMYQELGVYGTACTFQLPDFNNIVHFQPLTCGEYRISANYRGEVDTLYRKFQKTVGEVVKEFGLDRCIPSTQSLYKNGELDAWVTVYHAVEPRADRDPSKRDARNMAWRSLYFEEGCVEGQWLRESGFERFPVLAPRWQIFGGDIYGNSPGMRALGDVKQLQHQQLRKAEAIDYQTKPPIQIPGTAGKNREVEMLPGGVTYVDAATAQAGIRPMWEVNLNLQYLLNDIQEVRQRIREAFFVDMFLSLSDPATTRMTATEVAERHEEKLVMIGPTLERIHDEALNPLVETTFERLLAVGLLPPPPPEMQGQDLNVEFVSMLAQAQRAVGINSTDRFVLGLGQVAQIKPDVLDKFDADQWADQYADQLGVDPRLIVGNEQVAIVRQQRAQQQQAAQAAAMATEMAGAAKDLGSVNTSQPNGLTDLINQFQGYTLPGL